MESKEMFKLPVVFTIVAFTLLSPFTAIANAEVRSSQKAEQQPFDIQFLDTMARHHELGLPMMKIAAEKAQSPDVRDMAARMAANEEKDRPELTGLRRKVDERAPTAINKDMPGMDPVDSSELQKFSGKKFDLMFLDKAIRHHEGAVEMAGIALEKAQDSDVKGKAQAIFDRQKTEIAEMEGLREKIGGEAFEKK